MFVIDQHIGNYPIKRVLTPEGDIQRYLSEDPFFNSSITLNILDIRSFSQEQKHQLFSVLQKLFLLENQAISPVFDSGFEADYIFYTNGRDQKISLLDKLESAISFEECLYTIKNIAIALRMAAEKNLTHGLIRIDDIYFNKGNQPFIENFGVKHYFSAIKNNINTVYSIKDSLSDIDKIISKIREKFSEKEKNNKDYDKKLNDLSKYLINDSKNISKEFDNLENKIDSILSIPSHSIIPTSNLEQDSFNINNREDVLPFIRSVIEERNKLKVLLVEEKKKCENISNNNIKNIEKIEFIKNSFKNENIKRNRNNKKIIYISVVLSFLFGFFICFTYMNNFKTNKVEKLTTRKNPISAPKVENNLLSKNIPEEELPVAKEVNNNSHIVFQPEQNNKTEIQNINKKNFQIDEKVTPPIVKKAEVTWWPEGQEFETDSGSSVSNSEIEIFETDTIFSQILNWSAAWEKQDIEGYLSFYSKNFSPGGGKSLAEWKKIRRLRLQRPDWIKIAIQDIDITRITAEKIQVEFQQIYQSNSYRDEAKKVMAMELTDGHWLIESEKSL